VLQAKSGVSQVRSGGSITGEVMNRRVTKSPSIRILFGFYRWEKTGKNREYLFLPRMSHN